MSITAQDDTQTRPADQAGRGARVRLWLTWARSYFSVPRWWLELAVIYSIYRVYSYIRNLGGKEIDPAFRHGTAVLDLEKKLHIDIEMSLNKFGEHVTIVRDVASLHYHTLHWWMTIGTAVWLFVMHQCRRVHALLVECGQQIGEEMFHAAGEGRVVLANMQDAHGFIQDSGESAGGGADACTGLTSGACASSIARRWVRRRISRSCRERSRSMVRIFTSSMQKPSTTARIGG